MEIPARPLIVLAVLSLAVALVLWWTGVIVWWAVPLVIVVVPFAIVAALVVLFYATWMAFGSH